jgi:hypothetical protein
VIGGRSGASRDAQMKKLLATYLPKATVGSEMLVASWQDAAPPPLPGRKPALAEVYAQRLLASAAQPDPIAATLLAYAADTAGTRPSIITPDVATGALEAVIAAAVPTAPPAPGTLTAVAVPSPAPRGDLGDLPPAAASFAIATAAPAAVLAPPLAAAAAAEEPVAIETVTAYAAEALSDVERAATLMATPGAPEAARAAAPAPAATAGGRFAIAFATFEAAGAPRQLRREDILAAVERARPPATSLAGHSTVEIGSAAPRTPAAAPPPTAVATPAALPARAPAAPAGWQIQVGAVASAGEAEAIHDDAVRRVPALDSYERVTLTVRTDKGTFYRARFAGFGSEDEAKAFCERFSNHNRPCWAVAM